MPFKKCLSIRRRLGASLALEQKWFAVEWLTSATVSIHDIRYKPETIPPVGVHSRKFVHRETSYRVIIHRVEIH